MALVYDDNLFWEPEPTSDFLWRVSPALVAQHRSPRLTLQSSYTFDAERFIEQTAESTPLARQRAALGVTGRPNAGTTLRVDGAYASTSTPFDFNVTTGLGPGRFRARSWDNGVRLTQAVSPQTTLQAAYTLAAQFARDLGDIVTHTADFGVTRRLGARDAVHVTFTEHRFSFDPGEVVHSQAGVFGWERRVTPRLNANLEAGPRYAFGTFKPEVSARLNLQARRTGLAAAYVVTQTTAVGITSTIDVQRIEGQITHRPTRRAEGLLRGTLFVNTLGSRASHVYRVAASITGPVTETLRFTVGYSTDFLTGNLYRGPEASLSLKRHVVAFGLILVPWRSQ